MKVKKKKMNQHWSPSFSLSLFSYSSSNEFEVESLDRDISMSDMYRWKVSAYAPCSSTCTTGEITSTHRQCDTFANTQQPDTIHYVCRHKHILCLMCEVWRVRGGWELLRRFDQAGAHTWVLYRERVPAQVWYWKLEFWCNLLYYR